MKTFNASSEDSIGIIIVLSILTLGGFLVYRKFFANQEASSASTPSTPVFQAPPAQPKPTSITTEELKNRPTISELQNSAKFLTKNPAIKGTWKNTTPNYITEPFLNQIFWKDKPVKIVGENVELGYYKCEYYSKTCWFPKSELNESGRWTSVIIS